MSVTEHRHAAPTTPLSVRVLVVSSTRTSGGPKADTSGAALCAAVQAAGHTCPEPKLVDDDVSLVRSELRALVDAGADAVLITGGTGLSGRDVTPEALAPLADVLIPGFGELFRYLSFQEIGPAAMLSRASACVVGRAVVFALPGSEAACKLAVEKLILPELAHMVGQVRRERDVNEYPAVPDVTAEVVQKAPAEARAELKAEAEPEAVPLPPPSGKLGRLGQGSMQVGLSQVMEPTPSAAATEEEGALPGRGWLRAVHEISGEILWDKREELPQPVERFAPLVELLGQAGEAAVLKLPNGVKYGLYGYPDLRRPGAKVLAVGWGDPLCEVLALHRYPVMTGTCVDGKYGQLPKRGEDVGQVCEAVTGRAPQVHDAELFAVQGDSVLYERQGKVFRWDGRQERAEGNLKQSLASLVLHWSQR